MLSYDDLEVFGYCDDDDDDEADSFCENEDCAFCGANSDWFSATGSGSDMICKKCGNDI